MQIDSNGRAIQGDLNGNVALTAKQQLKTDDLSGRTIKLHLPAIEHHVVSPIISRKIADRFSRLVVFVVNRDHGDVGNWRITAGRNEIVGLAIGADSNNSPLVVTGDDRLPVRLSVTHLNLVCPRPPLHRRKDRESESSVSLPQRPMGCCVGREARDQP